MKPPATNGSEPEEVYKQFVEHTASKLDAFKPLNAFLRAPPQHTPLNGASTFAVEYSSHSVADEPFEVKESDLKYKLKEGIKHQLFVVENITSEVMALLGGYCAVDPQFFLDYLDMVIEPKSNGEDTQTKPWYRIEKIEEHMPQLASVKSQSDHVTFRFIGPREYRPDDAEAPAIQIPERITSDKTKTRVTRIAGGHNPIQLKNKVFHPAAMTRHHASAWFGTNDAHGVWQKGIILIDPPFESSEIIGQRQNSKYRSFISRPLPPTAPRLGDKDICPRDSGFSILLHCLKWNPMLQVVGIPLPLVILQNLHWIIASEWLCVTIYMERELNTIEWRLENEKTSLEGFEFYLEKLFTMRRRISKYKSLVDDHFQSCLSHTPKSWYTSGQTPPRPQGGIGSSFHEVYSSIQRDIEHVQSLIQRNADRITETVTLITSLMSVLEGKTALKQNQRLGLLTIFATLALPFNAAAAIFSVQTEFGPGGKQFGVFWEVAGSILGLAALLLALLYLVPWLIANRKAPIKGLRR